MREPVGLYVYGDVEIFLRRPGQPDETLQRRKNLVLYSAYDLLAKAAGGQQLVNGMYLAYSNDAVPADVVPPERRASWYSTTGSVAPLGFVRVPLIGEPAYASTDATRYLNNRVSFTAISDGRVCVPVSGNELTDGVSKFYGAALIWLGATYAQDVLFSAVNFKDATGADYYLKIPNGQVGVRWFLSFYPSAAIGSSSE
jgi:hypothetical protein